MLKLILIILAVLFAVSRNAALLTAIFAFL